MKKNLTTLLRLIVATLFVSSPLLAGPGGDFGRGGGHGGGYGGGGGGGSGYSGGAAHAGGSLGAAHTAGPSHGFNHSPGFRSYGGGPGHPGWAGPGGPHGSWYHGDWGGHYHWDHPWGYGPWGWGVGFGVGFGLVTAAVVWDAPWYWGYYPYYNPYYTRVVVIDNTTAIDYSRPIVVAAPAAQAGVIVNNSAAASQSIEYLEASRKSFMGGDYSTAMMLVNSAIAKQPSDPALHEFRGLILFATRQYKDAAAAIYSVLSIGPGWDWTTLSSLYPDTSIYTAQLRELERYRNEHPEAPEAHFLLAYHYMSCGHSDSAIAELRDVVRLSPKDQLSGQLLAGLSEGKAGVAGMPAMTPPAPVKSIKPVETADLIGEWEASRSDGASFAFQIGADKTFSWRYTLQDKTQQFTGTYTLAEGTLILKQGGNPTIIGQVALLDGGRFNFKLAGNSNAADPGLTFSKRR